MQKRRFLKWAGTIVLALLVCSCAFTKYNPVKVQTNVRAEPYAVLEDRLDTRIFIGVRRGIDEETLRATLAKAADEHQRDAGRDYLITQYFRVIAHLVNGAEKSKLPAGTLRRYVPPADPNVKETPADGADDQLTITLNEANQSF